MKHAERLALDADRAQAAPSEGKLSVQGRLAGCADRLTATDKRIWAELQRDPALAVFQSAEAVALGANVNQASVVRFAQKLGYSGFVELRKALRERVRDTTSPGQRLRKLVDTSEGQTSSLGQLLAQQAEALVMATTTVSERVFEAAAERLAGARTIHVFASGHATALAELSLRRFSRIGCHVVDLRGSPRDVIERVARMGSGDALLVFAFRTPPRYLSVLLDIASDCRAGIIALTDVLAPDLARADAQILAASRGTTGDYQTLTVPLAIMEALAIAVAKRRPDEATEALDRISAVAQRLELSSSSRPASGPLDKRRKRNRDR